MNTPFPDDAEELTPKQHSIAPAWHTIVLVIGILAFSFHGAAHFALPHGPVNRLETYESTAAMELLLFGWVGLGLYLRRIPIRSLLGFIPGDARSIATDLGIAIVFWIGSLAILGTVGILWTSVEASLTHRQPLHPVAQTFAPDPTQQQTLRTLEQLAPSNGEEIAGWIVLCILVGVLEEIVFRGYLQIQFMAWARGNAAAGVVFSALVFGGAHAYQGLRNMVLLAVFGALFGLLALYRGSLRAGMFAHSWQDIVAGLVLMLLKSYHFI